MGAALTTVGFSAKAAAAAGSAATAFTGTSLVVPSFSNPASCRLVQLARHDETGRAGFVQIKSPNLANSSVGIQVFTDEWPSVAILPGRGLEKLVSADTLTATLASGAVATKYTAGYLGMYFSTLPGATQKLHAWGDISGVVAHVFTQSVAVTTGATPGWTDKLSNSTVDLMEAATNYALLGYVTDAAYGQIGLKAPETSTRRVTGPGTTSTVDTSEYFVQLGQVLGVPCIPVVTAGNRGNINVSASSAVPATVGTITLIWAQLSTKLV